MNRKFAIIPWSSSFGNDRMFAIDDPSVNRDYLMEPYYEMRKAFEANGDELHTLDKYNFNEVDYFLFFELDWDVVRKVIRNGKASRMVYCNAEPPIVYPRNTPEGYKKLGRYFPYIMTFNPDWVDNDTVYLRNDPYYFVDDRNKAQKYSDKKLVTFISSNKHSEFPNELYSERLAAIDYFEKMIPDEFDFYGMGWDKKEHTCYKGTPTNKREIYYRYKFAICYENMKNIKGYVSEKILDCLVTGIVPIYAGASNICEYVPENCFIDRYKFKGYDELLSFIKNMDEEKYNSYLIAADQFLKSDNKNKFSGTVYANCIYDAIRTEKNFSPSISARIDLYRSCLKSYVKRKKRSS